MSTIWSQALKYRGSRAPGFSTFVVAAAGILFPLSPWASEATRPPPCSAPPSAAGFPSSPSSASPRPERARRQAPTPREGPESSGAPLVQSPCVSWEWFRGSRASCLGAQLMLLQTTCVQVSDFKSFSESSKPPKVKNPLTT